MKTQTYDEIAFRMLLKGASKDELAEVSKHARNEVPCPECGSNGPHDEGYGSELVCDCGVQFERPPVLVPTA